MSKHRRLNELSFSSNFGGGGYRDNSVAADLVASHEAPLSDRLDALGVAESTIPEVIELIDAEARTAGFHYAAELVRWIAQKLANHSTQAAAVCAALEINEDGISKMAARLNVTKQGVGNHVVKIRSAFGLCRKPPVMGRRPEVVRPTEPGTWLTRPEARQLSGIDVETLLRLGVRESAVGRQKFIERDSMMTAMERRELGRAKLRLENPSLKDKHYVSDQ